MLRPTPFSRQVVVALTPLLLQLLKLFRPSHGIGLEGVQLCQAGVCPGEGILEPERFIPAGLRAKEAAASIVDGVVEA